MLVITTRKRWVGGVGWEGGETSCSGVGFQPTNLEVNIKAEMHSMPMLVHYYSDGESVDCLQYVHKRKCLQPVGTLGRALLSQSVGFPCSSYFAMRTASAYDCSWHGHCCAQLPFGYIKIEQAQGPAWIPAREGEIGCKLVLGLNQTVPEEC